MADIQSNGRVTLALLGEKLNTVISNLGEIKTEVQSLHDCSTRRDELDKAIKRQIWDGSESRIDQALVCSKAAMAWVKGAIVPIALAITIGLIMAIIKLTGG